MKIKNLTLFCLVGAVLSALAAAGCGPKAPPDAPPANATNTPNAMPSGGPAPTEAQQKQIMADPALQGKGEGGK